MNLLTSVLLYRYELITFTSTSVADSSVQSFLGVPSPFCTLLILRYSPLVVHFHNRLPTLKNCMYVVQSILMDWQHSRALMLYTGYVEPRDGAVSVSSLVLARRGCVRCIQKESHCCEGQLSVGEGNRECRSLSNGKMSSSTK
jgi:hypothetical protein